LEPAAGLAHFENVHLPACMVLSARHRPLAHPRSR